MTIGNIFIFLHVFTMFVAVALSVGTALLLQRVAAAGNIAAIRTTFGTAAPLGRRTPMVFGVGMLFGFIAAIIAQFNLLAPWLIITYVLVIVSMYLSSGIYDRWAANVGRAAAANQGDTPSPELQQLINDKRATQATYANIVIIALIVLVMVIRPFS